MKLTAFARARHGLLLLAASLGIVFGLSAAPAQAATTASASGNWIVTFKANHSGKCLEVADWSTANGAAVRQWTCTDGANQQWEQIPSNYPGEYYYRNMHSGKCMEIGGWGTNNGATANQWDCHWGLNQLFVTGQEKIITDFWYAQNKCLEIADWRRDNGAPARLWDCHIGDNQSFTMKLLSW
ncbi:RICIN domain-containing protein [Streptomyces sp. NPDC056944]|uniref:RICIN domain-containing protein n=1 Tax=Streptomyces sp. NPDC056944 TaxID=3345972 RepID=UPI00363BE004